MWTIYPRYWLNKMYCEIGPAGCTLGNRVYEIIYTGRSIDGVGTPRRSSRPPKIGGTKERWICGRGNAGKRQFMCVKRTAYRRNGDIGKSRKGRGGGRRRAGTFMFIVFVAVRRRNKCAIHGGTFPSSSILGFLAVVYSKLSRKYKAK